LESESRPTTLFYSDNSEGSQDIKFIYEKEDASIEDPYYGPFAINMVNTENDEAYPVLDSTLMYFCSDRDGQSFNIYSLGLQNVESHGLMEYLQLDTENPIITKIDTLSSVGDEKCPFINGNLMVFASNDNSGYGGYDLWYSIKRDGMWQAPKNFGKRVNTGFDEFRPVVMSVQESNNDVMVFSSNRPGGKGGFDLYYIGISKLTE